MPEKINIQEALNATWKQTALKWQDKIKAAVKDLTDGQALRFKMDGKDGPARVRSEMIDDLGAASLEVVKGRGPKYKYKDSKGVETDSDAYLYVYKDGNTHEGHDEPEE